MFRVLCCGSRDWDDEDIIRVVLSGLLQARGGRPFGVIHGDNGYDSRGKALWGKPDRLAVKGADKLAGKVARELGCKVKRYTPNWEKYGKAAGPKRNNTMLDKGKPHLVVAFHDYLSQGSGTGTFDMVVKAVSAGVPVYTVGHWEVPF